MKGTILHGQDLLRRCLSTWCLPCNLTLSIVASKARLCNCNLTSCVHVQDPSRNAIALPIDLWADILKHLDTRARLTARLVCKAFSTPGPEDTILITTKSPTESQALSIARFCNTIGIDGSYGPVCNFKDATPTVPPKYGHVPNPWMAPCLHSALQLVNLRSLELVRKLSHAEAEMLLLILPPELTSLHLSTQIMIVENSAWSKLPFLLRLDLTVDNAMNIKETNPISATGLAKLPALQSLYLMHYSPNRYEGPPRVHPRCISLANVCLRKLLYLGVSWDAFTVTDLEASAPALITLSLMRGHCQFPDWILGHRIRGLACHDWSAALRSHAPDRLQCNTFHVPLGFTTPQSSFPGEHRVDVAELLKLPELKKLHAKKSHSVDDGRKQRVALVLAGSSEDFQRLQAKLRFKFDKGTDVRICDTTSNRMASIRENGHPYFCRCLICQ